jgi:hypothetical protein
MHVGEIDERATFAVAEFKAAEIRIIEHERKLMQAQGRAPIRV